MSVACSALYYFEVSEVLLEIFRSCTRFAHRQSFKFEHERRCCIILLYMKGADRISGSPPWRCTESYSAGSAGEPAQASAGAMAMWHCPHFSPLRTSAGSMRCIEPQPCARSFSESPESCPAVAKPNPTSLDMNQAVCCVLKLFSPVPPSHLLTENLSAQAQLHQADCATR
jgi:hypothetical protein